MYVMIGGVIYDRKRSDSQAVLTCRSLGSQREASISVPFELSEPDVPETVLAWWRDKLSKPLSASDRRAKDEANAARVAARRKTELRRRVKAQGCDTLLTLTYRGAQPDLTLAWAHWKEFVRRVKRCMGHFTYSVVWERQKRGTWHAHAAIHRVAPVLPYGGAKVKSYSVLRAIWRSVTGDLAGNVDLSMRKRRSPAKVAAYLSKYMAKTAVIADAHANLWASSTVHVPPPIRIPFRRQEMLDALAICAEFVTDAGVLCSAWVAPWGDTVFLAGEASG
jgi:hypothetical protein